MKILNLLFIVTMSLLNFSAFAGVDKNPVVNDTSDGEKLDQSFKNKYVLAESYIESAKFQEAINLLKDLDSLTPSNANINYKLGVCFYNASTDKQAAIVCFEKAIQNINVDYKSSYNETNAPPIALYYLAKSYHNEYIFSSAIKSFEKYKTYLAKSDSKTSKEVDQYIAMCENGVKLMKSDLNPQIQILSAEINTKEADNSLMASSDNSVLVYSTTSNTNGKQGEISSYYYTELDGQKWSAPTKIGNDFSLMPSTVAAKLSSRKKEIFITKNTNGNKELYSLTYKDNKWSDPVKVGPSINSKSSISNACVSPDGNTLYFSSNKEGGYGGYDIYVCERLSDGSWSKAVNLGPNVNTTFDDVSPFIASDGVTLYFSSKGHNTMGGYDVFFTTLSDEGLWSLAENIGYPINTPQDDLFYIPSSDEKTAFYSSAKDGGLGDNDIYIIKYK